MIWQQIQPTALRAIWGAMRHRWRILTQSTWVKFTAFALLGYWLSLQGLRVEFHFAERPDSGLISSQQANFLTTASAWWEQVRDYQPPKSQLPDNLANAATATGAALSPAQQAEAARFSNLGLIINPDLAKRSDPAIVAAKLALCQAYIERFAATAQEEARLFNIPASIKLAQALLESNVGESRLASQEHNHFGIKCRQKCKGCRCANYTDDSQYSAGEPRGGLAPDGGARP